MKLFFIKHEGFDSQWALVRANSKEEAEDFLGINGKDTSDIPDANGCYPLEEEGELGVLWGHSQDGITGDRDW